MILNLDNHTWEHQGNINKVKKCFDKEFQPYEIGLVSKGNKKIKIFNNLRW